jgi:acyl-CoA synthetase (NDP forming)
VRELPEPPELVVIAVPSAGVLEVAEEALQSGARGLLVVASGFAETGPEGARLQERLVELVRSRGARLIGPNCLGLMNTHPDVRLNASLAPAMAPRGRIGFFSHSAALGIVILKYAEERGLGFSTFVSAGNRADVSGNDLLQFWEEDPSTDIALLYLETFGDPRRFARIARRLAYRKAVLCVKSARSRAGHDLARAHIGAVAQSETNVETLFRQAGVIRADTLEEMFDVAALLASQPLPRGERVAIVSNSGGVLTICADACEAQGLVIAGPGVVDLGPLAAVAEYEKAVHRAAAHPEVDALIAIFACVGDCDPQTMGRAIRRGVLKGERESGVSKPALLCLMGAAGTIELGVARDDEGDAARRVFPSYRFPESAARALARAAQYAAFRRRPAGRLVWYDDVDAPAARHAVAALRESATSGVLWLEGESAAAILASFGIGAGAAGETARDGEELVLEMQPDRSFGPLVRVRRGGAIAAVRITPLTDRDVDEIIAGASLPAGRGLEELFGRVSQMIEELPWLCGIVAGIHAAPAGGGKAYLGPRIRIGFFTDRIDSNDSAGKASGTI